MPDKIAQNAAGVQIEIFDIRVDFFTVSLLSVCLTSRITGGDEAQRNSRPCACHC